MPQRQKHVTSRATLPAIPRLKMQRRLTRHALEPDGWLPCPLSSSQLARRDLNTVAYQNRRAVWLPSTRSYIIQAPKAVFRD